MVRIKNRYLLLNILYPGLEKKSNNVTIPDVIQLNQPTTDALTPQALLKGLRAEILQLFGDYGAGAASESLSGKFTLGVVSINANCICSEISFAGYFNVYSSRLATALQDSVGSAFIYECGSG